ncbi:hypothetical protein R0290_04420 [Burkholderia semiarida]|uniref:hypothetical protein n=1 Tax=Burkholderia TaxID=32008 RepID=UPI00265E308A|nr:hypothetical protein [Burkholderia sp. AU44665]MDN7698156.1 hypothetical protein [Burkholderia sp. AU44665]
MRDVSVGSRERVADDADGRQSTRTDQCISGLTLHELSCVLGGSQGQVIGAAFDLKHFGYIDITEEQNDNRRCVLRPIRDRMFGFDGYLRLVNKLASDAGIAERLEALLPLY